MTPAERKQPKQVFVSAGKHAFMIGVHFLENPYREQPFKVLWEKGYNAERKKYVKKAVRPKPVASNFTRTNGTA